MANILPAEDDASTANVVENRTTPVFLSVTLADDIGEQAPVGVAYYAPVTTPGNSGSGAGNANTSILIPPAPAGYELVHFDEVAANTPITLYRSDDLYQYGKDMNWVNVDTNEKAYEGMKVSEFTMLKLEYENLNFVNVIPQEYYVYVADRSTSIVKQIEFVGVSPSYWTDNNISFDTACSIIVPDYLTFTAEEITAARTDASNRITVSNDYFLAPYGRVLKKSSTNMTMECLTPKGIFIDRNNSTSIQSVFPFTTANHANVNIPVAIVDIRPNMLIGTFSDVAIYEDVSAEYPNTPNQYTFIAPNIQNIAFGGCVDTANFYPFCTLTRMNTNFVNSSNDLMFTFNNIHFNYGLKQIYHFDNVLNATSVTFPNTLIHIGELGHCGVTSLDIPASVTQLCGIKACPNLQTVNIQNKNILDYGVQGTVTPQAYNGAIYACPNLTTVYYPLIADGLGENSFVGDSSLSDVYYPGTCDEWNALNIPMSTNTPMGYPSSSPYHSNRALKQATIHCSDGNLVWDATTEGFVNAA